MLWNSFFCKYRPVLQSTVFTRMLLTHFPYLLNKLSGEHHLTYTGKCEVCREKNMSHNGGNCNNRIPLNRSLITITILLLLIALATCLLKSAQQVQKRFLSWPSGLFIFTGIGFHVTGLFPLSRKVAATTSTSSWWPSWSSSAPRSASPGSSPPPCSPSTTSSRSAERRRHRRRVKNLNSWESGSNPCRMLNPQFWWKRIIQNSPPTRFLAPYTVHFSEQRRYTMSEGIWKKEVERSSIVFHKS